MERAKLSLKWLEVFQAVARSGSVRAASQRLELSMSTVSQHLTCLEEAVAVELIDHGRRPMRLTPAGEILLRRVDESLLLLRKGITEVWSSDPGSLVRRLQIASIEDLDVEVTPFLAARLVQALPACEMSFLSRPSHEVMSLLQGEDVDMGIAAAAEQADSGLVERPLLRDPYVLIAPAARDDAPADYLDARTGLPLLRYSKKQLIGRRVDLQLRRLRKDIPHQIEFESTQPILSLIAEARAWTITTALNFACAYRHQDQIKAMPMPDGSFARRLSLFGREDLPGTLLEMVDGLLRTLVQTRIVEPTLRQAPWLEAEFRLLTDTA